jgi:hypothetical protein
VICSISDVWRSGLSEKWSRSGETSQRLEDPTLLSILAAERDSNYSHLLNESFDESFAPWVFKIT